MVLGCEVSSDDSVDTNIHGKHFDDACVPEGQETYEDDSELEIWQDQPQTNSVRIFCIIPTDRHTRPS